MILQENKLLDDVIAKANELNINVCTKKAYIGFSKDAPFFMFWITTRHHKLSFNFRKRLIKVLHENVARLPFDEDHRDEIFVAIEECHQEYLRASSSGELRAEIDTPNHKKYNYHSNNKYPPSEIDPVWKELIESIAEKNKELPDRIPEVTSSRKQLLQDTGTELSELFIEMILQSSKFFKSNSLRDTNIFIKYISSDTTTLAAIGYIYNLSRERIRQIVSDTDQKLKGRLLKTLKRGSNEAFNNYVKRFAELFAEIDYDIYSLYLYGLDRVSNRQKSSFLRVLCGTELSESVIKECQKVNKEKELISSASSIQNNKLAHWKDFESKFRFPSDICIDPSASVSSTGEPLQYKYLTEYLEKLKSYEQIAEIIVNPDIVFYCSSRSEHRPHFLLRLTDGRQILVLLFSTLNMALIYNIKRCNALHTFCKSNGYGYLITDEHKNSIYDIMSRPIDTFIEESLNTVLDSKGFILWDDIAEIKSTKKLSNIDIAAYVIQNKLHFTKSPFCIRHRKDMNSL